MHYTNISKKTTKKNSLTRKVKDSEKKKSWICLSVQIHPSLEEICLVSFVKSCWESNGHGWGGNDHLSSSEIFQSSAKINYRWAEEPENLRKCCIYYRLETCLVRNWLVIAPLFLGLQLFSHFINRKMLAAFSDCFFCPTNSQKPNGT